MFKLNAKQADAMRLFGGPATHIMLWGGSRSGKTFVTIRAIVLRALAAPGSRHAILRFRFNHVKASVVLDTFPKVMALCFPGVAFKLDKTDFYAEFPNGSQIWFGGLDDKERTEKILGQEYASIYFNESSQIPFASRSMAVTRLAQKCEYEMTGERRDLRLKAYYDCNPPSQAHWTYKLFVLKRDPETNNPIVNCADYDSLQLNPRDNLENLAPGYLDTLESLPARMKLRFLEGRFADVTANALWSLEQIETWRVDGALPDMQRIVVAVDPSGADDKDNLDNDAIGVVVAGLGMDGNGYVLEDLTLKGGPNTWGKVVASAYDRHRADMVVGETNFGGGMVKFVVQSARPATPFRAVTASRGKAVRAEPISALAEQGRIRHAGRFLELEDELCAFTTAGYLGAKSPNRADAYVWAFTELFPGIVRREPELIGPSITPALMFPQMGQTAGWML